MSEPNLKGVPEDWHGNLIDIHFGIEQMRERSPLLSSEQLYRLAEELDRTAQIVRDESREIQTNLRRWGG